MQIISSVSTKGTRHVTAQVASHAETWPQFLNEVEGIRYECQPRKGRSLMLYGDFIVSFPHMMIPSITVRVGEVCRGCYGFSCRITYMINGKKASRREVMRLWA